MVFLKIRLLTASILKLTLLFSLTSCLPKSQTLVKTVVVAPDTPSGLSARVSSKKVVLQWNAVVPASSSRSVTYEVWRRLSTDTLSTKISESIQAVHYEDSSVTNAKTYVYRIKAVTSGASSSFSADSSAKPDVEFDEFSSTPFSEWQESLATVRSAGVTSTPTVSFISTPGITHEYGALARNGMIYTVPWGGTQFAKVDTTNDTVSLLPTIPTGGQYLRPILAPNGKLYVFGLDSGLASYRIDPADDSVTPLTIPAYNGTRSFWGAALGKNGKIYAVPAGFGATGRILEYDPITESASYQFSAYTTSPQFTFTFPTYGSDGFLYLVPRISGQPLQKMTFDSSGLPSVTTVATPTFTYLERPLPDLFGNLFREFPTNEYTSIYEGIQRFGIGATDWSPLSTLSNTLQGRHVCLGGNEKYYWVNLNNNISEYDPRLDTTTEIVTDRKSTRLNSSHSTLSRMPSSA